LHKEYYNVHKACSRCS